MTLKLDNRGTANRGRAFERAIRSNGAVLGDVEVADQVAGVRFLVEKRIVDPKRVAIVGWSYGGFVAAAALLRAPETFACAVAGAPSRRGSPTTHYSERYLGAPGAAGGASRYRRCDLLTFVRERTRRDPRVVRVSQTREKKMLLAHGASGENVHLSHRAPRRRARRAGRRRRASRFAGRPNGRKTEEETERGAVSRSVSSSFDVAVFARERHVPRGRPRREFEGASTLSRRRVRVARLRVCRLRRLPPRQKRVPPAICHHVRYVITRRRFASFTRRRVTSSRLSPRLPPPFAAPAAVP